MCSSTAMLSLFGSYLVGLRCLFELFRRIGAWRSSDFSVSVPMFRASLSRSSTTAVRFVFWPPRQMNTPENIPHKKLAGIKIPVDQAGRWNLLSPHIVPHKII